MLIETSLMVVASLLAYKLYKRPKNYPPGPRGLPLLGYLPFVTEHHPKYPYIALQKLSEIYGSVVGFYMGPRQAFISVCGYDAVKEALHNQDLDGRPAFRQIIEDDAKRKLGVMFSEGEFWQEQRRFSLRHLRDLGFGKTSAETMIHEEIQDLIQEIKQSADSNGVVDLRGIFNISMVNVLWAIVGGQRFDHNDRKFKEFLLILETIFRTGNAVRIAFQLPNFVLKIMPFLRKYTGVRNDLFPKIAQFLMEAIDEHEKTRVAEEPRDFIDVYLDAMEKQGASEDSTFFKNQLLVAIFDFFGAGAESTSNSVGFAILHLIHNIEAQEKMQKELDAVCGDSLPSLTQRSELTYSEAVLMEAQRISSIAPLTVPHFAMKDTHLQGHTIPKGSLVAVNLHSVHNDPTFWKDPQVFRPERHLNDEGKLSKTDHFLPFGVGKRMCLGESLAKNAYFLFTTSLVKTFRFDKVPGQPLPTLDPVNGFTLGYDGFSAVVTSRN